MPIRKSLWKIAVLCHTARSILNRCETHALLRKNLQVFIKRQALIGVDSRLCVLWKGKFGGKLFCGGQKVSFVRIGKFYKKMQKLWFSSNKASNKSQNFYQFTPF